MAEKNPEIVSRGPGAEEPLGEPATVDTFTPRVGAVATESKEHGVPVKVEVGHKSCGEINQRVVPRYLLVRHQDCSLRWSLVLIRQVH